MGIFGNQKTQERLEAGWEAERQLRRGLEERIKVLEQSYQGQFIEISNLEDECERLRKTIDNMDGAITEFARVIRRDMQELRDDTHRIENGQQNRGIEALNIQDELDTFREDTEQQIGKMGTDIKELKKDKLRQLKHGILAEKINPDAQYDVARFLDKCSEEL